jgi:D-lactate dehydrogenase (cytochrome)
MDYFKLSKACLSDLKAMVERKRISFGDSVCELHSKDQSSHTPCRPSAVLWPQSREEVSKILSYANKHMIPVTPWGMGSSLEGNPIPVAGGIVLDFSMMNRILRIREEDFQADLEPGVVYQDLNEAIRHKGLFFPPDPGARATIGGMIGNNSSGSRTVRYGATKDHVMRLVVALADGQIIEVGNRASKSSSGYDLLHLFVGSEGTLGVTVEATVRLTPIPAEFSAAVASFEEVRAAAQAVFEIRNAGLEPAALELLSGECMALVNNYLGLSMQEEPTLFMEFAGPSSSYLREASEIAGEICREKGATAFHSGIGRQMRDHLFKARHGLGEMIIRTNPGKRVFTTDVAVPISLFPAMIAFADEKSRSIGLPSYLFSHAGDGNIHLVLLASSDDDKEMALVQEINSAMVEKALELGGTATGEHGVGIGKRRFMEAEHGASLAWMRRVKGLFDPNGILNPGKIFP